VDTMKNSTGRTQWKTARNYSEITKQMRAECQCMHGWPRLFLTEGAALGTNHTPDPVQWHC